jgi:Fe-S-cluster containining protein
MLTDLVQIKRLGEQQKEENSRFRAYLKNHRHSDRRLRRFGEEIEAEIDCTQCANCCRVATTPLNDRDVERISRGLGMRKHEFLEQYTVKTEEGIVLRRTEDGCVFLNGNLCSIYEIRPQTCELFPHLVKGNGSFVSRMWHMPDRAVYCPIVFNSLEQFKVEAGFKK